MCLTVEWDLLDTDSIVEEFDGWWRWARKQAQVEQVRGSGSKWGPLGESARREEGRATKE
jgi:hypothetical protein